MEPIIDIQNLTKKYADGYLALDNVSAQIAAGEIIALLGPNGAGKTTLISIICGLTTITKGTVSIDGCDVVSEYRKARSIIGLVPQELMLELTKSGISREKAYRIVQTHAKKCLSQNLNLFEVVKKNKIITDKIPLNKLKKIFNYSSHFKNVNLIFNRVFR